MNQDVYLKYRNELKGMHVKAYKGYMHLGIFFLFAILGILFSQSPYFLVYLLGQFILIFVMLNSQILLHELGHGFFLKHKKMNHVFGHLIALGPIIPYQPWVLVHGQHHRWSGNKYKDPTMLTKSYDELKEREKKIINFCWKYWIPIFGISYSIRAFWQLKELNRNFPDHKLSVLISMIIPFVVYLPLLIFIPGPFLKTWLPAYYIFMAIGEPLLFSQHVHIDQADARYDDFEVAQSFHVKDQDIFSRTLVFPDWFSKWILLGFNQHAIHHIFPNLPAYEYSRVKETFPNTVPWKNWYAFSKSTDVCTLLFKTNKETGLIKGQV